MAWMTQAEFEAKWGSSGKYHGGTWYLSSIGNIIANGVVPNTSESQYTAWDGFFTAVGCKPVDPRDAVFKAYGWTYHPESKREFAKWAYRVNGMSWFVYQEEGTVHKAGRGYYEDLIVTTAAQAEALCVLMGLTKVGGA